MEISRSLDLYYLLVGAFGIVMVVMAALKQVAPIKPSDKAVAPLYFVFGTILVVLWLVSPGYEKTYMRILQEAQSELCK